MLKNKRKIILDAAAESFSMYGFKATTIDQVAKLANVGKGTIYTTFKNKEDLFNAVLQEIIAEVQEVFQRSISENKDLFDNISSALAELLTFRKQHKFMTKLHHEMNVFASENSKRALKEIENVIIDAIDQLLKQAEENKKFQTTHRHVTAYLMYKTYILLVSDYEETYKPLKQDEIITIFKSHFMSEMKTT
ncbi:TetR family transcriptional regulator [Alkalihalobacillus alcalophilus ATCC 27647 = CGMCC 1.3604]|uniref:TetR family transcriptional regulator n=1 Tax=Alkalihalobacillus alcalophilus ATCC 27647 = CGMCC 1.3604 TaxID=1218173 RepID=A0A094YUC0_ALKAL|nr:TetR/AcrR family transcriptional regulator [Alkalihalobacillus alcalophilus]KGA97097.1 TetR family transcriptional regulator [Alkalihalobacillus alcalophilus ATCC 27647 = CGMCC 1.3604]MED1563066.1 TetR/AcrR family transcriptional regulator [Alkalihalobacillus alcalophilus]THG89854.1 TetR family transcriptional regulator [Alkalihalobacillus alcalophilus ATCC 27647 = CGMCC 1.3604]